MKMGRFRQILRCESPRISWELHIRTSPLYISFTYFSYIISLIVRDGRKQYNPKLIMNSAADTADPADTPAHPDRSLQALTTFQKK